MKPQPVVRGSSLSSLDTGYRRVAWCFYPGILVRAGSIILSVARLDRKKEERRRERQVYTSTSMEIRGQGPHFTGEHQEGVSSQQKP